jgi:hypothetical protein
VTLARGSDLLEAELLEGWMLGFQVLVVVRGSAGVGC